jgi:mono/diheme cytochrome c family protein
MHLVLKYVGVFIVLTFMSHADIAELYQQDCALCHESGILAPSSKSVAMAVRVKYPKKEDFVAFVFDFIQNPTKEKSLFGDIAYDKYGPMTSQAGVVSKKELKDLASYLYDTYASY